jgi:hypothetical protein
MSETKDVPSWIRRFAVRIKSRVCGHGGGSIFFNGMSFAERQTAHLDAFVFNAADGPSGRSDVEEAGERTTTTTVFPSSFIAAFPATHQVKSPTRVTQLSQRIGLKTELIYSDAVD